MEEENVLLVKEKSILEFFKDCLVVQPKRGHEREDLSPHNILIEELFVKKDYIDDETVIFEIQDFGAGSRRQLLNRYVYKVETYDDISDKLVLVNFLVDVVQ